MFVGEVNSLTIYRNTEYVCPPPTLGESLEGSLRAGTPPKDLVIIKNLTESSVRPHLL